MVLQPSASSTRTTVAMVAVPLLFLFLRPLLLLVSGPSIAQGDGGAGRRERHDGDDSEKRRCNGIKTSRTWADGAKCGKNWQEYGR
jgi:hypothetical protein